MIAQVLNRDFVIDQLEAVCWQLEQGPPATRRSDDALPFQHDASAYASAAAALRDAHRRETAASSGQAGFEQPTADRRNEVAAPLDDLAFISRDPLISLFQTALEEYFETKKDNLLDSSPPADDRRTGDDEILVTDVALANCPPTRKPLEGRRVFGSFSETDPRWVASWMAEGVRLFRGKHEFNLPPRPVKIANRCRIVMVGDWGSGLPRALKVANEMRKVLDEGKTKGIQQHVIHLGDVYYSGWQREYQHRFLNYWPVRPDEHAEIPSWSLNGNHDMYSGGHAYFDYLLADPRFALQERSSFFTMHNDFWNIVGLDTAYEDAALYGPQIDWLRQTLEGSSRKNMLLSHHQLFSVYEEPNDRVSAAMRTVLARKPIDAWFWGHEHRCVFYESTPLVRHARLIGHGGVPVYMFHQESDAYPPPAFYEYRAYLSKSFGLEHFALFGFAVLEVDEGRLQIRYIDENGSEHHAETLE
jgi:hypothetical protein